MRMMLVMAVAVGSRGADNIAVMEIELEAEKEDIQIVDMYLQTDSRQLWVQAQLL